MTLRKDFIHFLLIFIYGNIINWFGVVKRFLKKMPPVNKNGNTFIEITKGLP